MDQRAVTTQQPISMKGRLKEQWQEWEKLKPNKFVRVPSAIKNGYILGWKNNQQPLPYGTKNSQAAYDNKDFVTARLRKVQALHVPEECRREDLENILNNQCTSRKNSTELHLTIDGNPLKPRDQTNFQARADMATETRYLARLHTEVF
jgi:hypothetical protein